jgi:hypothetical protein
MNEERFKKLELALFRFRLGSQKDEPDKAAKKEFWVAFASATDAFKTRLSDTYDLELEVNEGRELRLFLRDTRTALAQGFVNATGIDNEIHLQVSDLNGEIPTMLRALLGADIGSGSPAFTWDLANGSVLSSRDLADEILGRVLDAAIAKLEQLTRGWEMLPRL